MSEEEIRISSSDYWFKVVEMLQQNWALIEPSAEEGCTVYFIQDLSGVFDQMEFPSIAEAESALRRNGFRVFKEDSDAGKFLTPPPPHFRRVQHPNGPVYSSGKYWV